MTISPSVELRFNPTDLRPRDMPRVGAFLGTPAEALEASLAVARAAMVDRMKEEMRGIAQPTQAQMLYIADLAWQGVFWNFRRISAPVIADAYLRAYIAADAGDVPMHVIYDLADKHAEKIGDYFHDSSREALADGFNTMVNRRVPARAAAEQTLEGFGLSPRQMRAFTSAKAFATPIDSSVPMAIRAKARAYVDKSFRSRIRTLAGQEQHNIDEQAKQFAWMWLQDKGRLSARAQKLWITARDERVCPVCGPLHGQKVMINEQFVVAQGRFWTPGVHPNCRCVVRLIENRFSKNAFGIIEKIDWNPKEHPRGGDPENKGRFSRVRVKEREAPVIASTIWESLAPVAEPVTRPAAPAQAPVFDIAPKAFDIGAAPAAQPVFDIAPAAAPMYDIALPTFDIDTKPTFDVQAQVVDIVNPQRQGMGHANLAAYGPYVRLSTDERPHYGVIHDPEYDPDMVLDMENFYDNLDDAKTAAMELREQEVDDLYDTVTSGGSMPVRVTGRQSNGRQMEAWIDDHEFKMALEAFAEEAQRGRSTEQMWSQASYIDVVWTDAATGDTVTEEASSISFADIVTQQGIEPDAFVFRILETTHGHNDENLTRLLRTGGGVKLSGQFVVNGVDGSVPDGGGKNVIVTPIRPWGS